MTRAGRLRRYALLVVLGDLSTTSGDSAGRSEPELEEAIPLHPQAELPATATARAAETMRYVEDLACGSYNGTPTTGGCYYARAHRSKSPSAELSTSPTALSA